MIKVVASAFSATGAPAVPTGTANGDILLVVGNAQTGSLTLPTGFTSLRTLSNAVVGWRLASNESGTYTVGGTNPLGAVIALRATDRVTTDEVGANVANPGSVVAKIDNSFAVLLLASKTTVGAASAAGTATNYTAQGNTTRAYASGGGRLTVLTKNTTIARGTTETPAVTQAGTLISDELVLLRPIYNAGVVSLIGGA